MNACVFCDIIAGRSAASIVDRDDLCIAFMDICPINAGHLLVVPIKHATYLSDLDPQIGAAMFGAAQRLSAAIRRSGLKARGINLLLADGEAAGQEVFHVHLHVLPRFQEDGFGHRFPPHYGQHPPEREHISRWELPRFLSTDDEGMGFRSLEYRDNGNAHSVKHLRLQEFSASARRLLSGPFPLPVNPVDLTGNGNGKSSRSHRAVRRNP